MLESSPPYQYDNFVLAQQNISNINILFIGEFKLFQEVKKFAPKNWKMLQTDTINKANSGWLETNIIIDALIQDPIDLSRKEFSKIRIICCASTGSSHLKIPIDKSDTILVLTLKDIPKTLNKLTSASEFSFGLLIALAKNMLPAAKSVSKGFWSRTEFPGQILTGKTLGIIGYGRIGKNMANYAKSFGMKVIFFDPMVTYQSNLARRYNSIEKLVSNSDFVSLHVPYDPKTSVKPIITKEIFSKFKLGSYFINTSRGELIDDSGLISAIENGVIRGAAIDVLTNEPKIHENLLFKFSIQAPDKILITPHIAGYSVENVKIATLGILDYLKTKLDDITNAK